ncbi:MAG: glycosyltransferase family 61 protein [Magnetococcus sp. MYC-9]
MNLDLTALLRLAFSQGEQPGRLICGHFIEYADRITGSAVAGLSTEGDRLAARLLWILSHYISASASSHGMQIGHIGGRLTAGSALDARFGRLVESFPTSVVLHALHWEGERWHSQAYAGGGKQTVFEAEDLAHFSRKKGFEKRLGILVVRHDTLGEGVDEPLNQLMVAQPLLSHVLRIRSAAQASPVHPFLTSEGWQHLSLAAGSVVLELHDNTQWDAQLSLLAPDVAPAVAPLATPQAEKCLPMVPAAQFGGIQLIDQFPAETLAGPELNFYSIAESGAYSRQLGRFAGITTQERSLYECTEVNISHTGIVWRGEQVLFDPYYAHFTDRKRLVIEREQAVVPEPTARLEGCYFLAITSNTHHSHLIFETLKKLHFAGRYQPHIKLLASTTLTQSQRDYFALFGFPEERCVYKHPDETWQVERVVFSSEAPMRYDRLSVEYLRSFGVARARAQSQWPTRVYISRRDSRVYRNLVNEEEIEKVFEWFGFSVILASDLSPQEKVELFSAAQYVAGPLGAAFSYMPFSLNGHTIMLTSDAYFPMEYQEIAAIRLKRLNVILGIGLKMYSSVWQYGHSSFYLPPGLVIAALDEILKAQH